MAVIEIEVEVWCSCGAGICHLSSTHPKGRGIVVEACDKCLEEAKKEGYDKGYEEGKERD